MMTLIELFGLGVRLLTAPTHLYSTQIRKAKDDHKKNIQKKNWSKQKSYIMWYKHVFILIIIIILIIK